MSKTDRDPATDGSQKYAEGRSPAATVCMGPSDARPFYDAPQLRAAYRAGWDEGRQHLQKDAAQLLPPHAPIDQGLRDTIEMLCGVRQDVAKLYGVEGIGGGIGPNAHNSRSLYRRARDGWPASAARSAVLWRAHKGNTP